MALPTTMVNSINSFNNGHHLVVGDLNTQNILWGFQNTSVNVVIGLPFPQTFLVP